MRRVHHDKRFNLTVGIVDVGLRCSVAVRWVRRRHVHDHQRVDCRRSRARCSNTPAAPTAATRTINCLNHEDLLADAAPLEKRNENTRHGRRIPGTLCLRLMIEGWTDARRWGGAVSLPNTAHGLPGSAAAASVAAPTGQHKRDRWPPPVSCAADATHDRTPAEQICMGAATGAPVYPLMIKADAVLVAFTGRPTRRR